MNEYPKLIKHYFQQHHKYFWKWSNDFQYLELFNGSTICLREELTAILKELGPEGLVRLGPILMVLIACTRDEKEREQLAFQLKLSYGELPVVSAEHESEALDHYVELNLKMMSIISQLPLSLRSRENKVLLIKELFDGHPRMLDATLAPAVVDEFKSGNYDTHIGKEAITRQFIKSELNYLYFAIRKYPDVKSLEMKLRTGIIKLPEAPEIKDPEPIEEDLLDALSRDPKTEGLARLTNRIIAAVHIPIHTRGSSDQSYGGVSDITNRGNFDRLLLSELAQDEEVLTARLVNNEALYLRREEPPVKRERQRSILIDTTIRMWGVPRVFAVSAAIACSYHVKNVSKISFFALREETWPEVELHTRRGVIETLEMLDAGLDSASALKGCMEQQPESDSIDYVYICEESFLRTHSYTSMMSEAKHLPGFIITVNRNGLLVFHQVIGRRLKIISKANFDLEELLFAPAKSKNQSPKKSSIPQFFAESNEELKLFLPSTGMRLGPNHCFYVEGKGLFGITEINRLLFWPSQNTGAIELIPYLPTASYWFGYDGSDLFILLTNTSNLSYLYKTDDKGNFKMWELERLSEVSEVGYQNGKFYAIGKEPYIIDRDGHVGRAFLTDTTGIIAAKKYREQQRLQNFKSFKRLINNGYTTVQRVGSVGISEHNTLLIDNRELVFSHGYIKFTDHSTLQNYRAKASTINGVQVREINNPSFNLTCFTFESGSKVYVDTRGFLHLVSHDEAIPELTIVFILSKSTACYVAESQLYAGSDYFIPEEKRKDKMDNYKFYNDYIRTFIEKALS